MPLPAASPRAHAALCSAAAIQRLTLLSSEDGADGSGLLGARHNGVAGVTGAMHRVLSQHLLGMQATGGACAHEW